MQNDKSLDLTLRPKNLSEFIGHKQTVRQLKVILEAAKERKEPLEHLLFHGPPGLGKTSLSHILAEEMGAKIVTTSGPAIEKAGDLAGILTNLEEGDILFIDEIHRLPRVVEEYLYPAMEDRKLDLIIDSGPGARSVTVSLNRFTLVGATTKVASMSSPMRSRFCFAIRLEYYDDEALATILIRSSQILGVKIDANGALGIAGRSRGTPRTANNLLRWVRDFAQLHNKNVIDQETVALACEMISIDSRGLDDMDTKILRVIDEHYRGGPVGIKTLAAALGEEEETLADIYEPYLIMKGFIKRTPRGRELTKTAYDHLKKVTPS